MKNITTIALLLSSIISFGQVEFFVNIGAKSFSQSGGAYTFLFTDDSPSQDVLNSSFSLSDQPVGFLCGISLMGKDDKTGDKHKIGIDARLYFAESGAFDIGVAYMYGLVDRYRSQNQLSFSWRIGASAGAGFIWKELGTIQNNAVYIQVNSTQFDDFTNVDASLNGAFGFINPRMEWNWFLDSQNGVKGVKFYIGYTFATRANSRIILKGDVNGERVSEDVSLSSGILIRNNERVEDLFISASGFEVGLGFSF